MSSGLSALDILVNKQIANQQDKRENDYHYLIFFSMLSMAIVLCKGIFSYRLVEINGYTIQAGQLIAPLWFLISDMIAEIYDYEIAKKTIVAGFVCQILFTIASICLDALPYPPSSLISYQAYHTIFQDIWRVNLAVLSAFIIAGYINIRLITKWKFLLKGKYFWLRSIGASGISELLFSMIATIIIQFGKLDFSLICKMVVLSYVLKIIYAVALSVPANITVYFVKKAEFGDAHERE